MSDNLRDAIGRYRRELANAGADGFQHIPVDSVLDSLRALLAAHPAPETVTEWGVVSFGFPKPIASEKEARALNNMVGNPLINRKVTAWKPVES